MWSEIAPVLGWQIWSILCTHLSLQEIYLRFAADTLSYKSFQTFFSEILQLAVNMHFWIQEMNVKHIAQLSNTELQMDDPRP